MAYSYNWSNRDVNNLFGGSSQQDYSGRFGRATQATVSPLALDPMLSGINPFATNWWEQPNAAQSYRWYEVNPTAFESQYARPLAAGQTAWQMPSWAQGIQPDTFAEIMSQMSPEAIAGWERTAAANEQYRQQREDVANSLSGIARGQAYDFSTAQAKASSTLQQAIDNFQNSPAYAYARQQADPNYKAMSDEFVNTQRVAAGQSIAQDQATAINAAIALAGRRGLTGSGLSPQLQAAANFQGAVGQADLAADLTTSQLEHNQLIRDAAMQQLTQRDVALTGLQQALATTQGAVNPHAENALTVAAASLLADQPVYAPDIGATMTSSETFTVLQPWLDLVEQTGDIRENIMAERDYYKGLAEQAGEEGKNLWNQFINGTLNATGLISSIFSLVLGFG